MHYRILNSIPGHHPLDAAKHCFLVVTTQNTPRQKSLSPLAPAENNCSSEKLGDLSFTSVSRAVLLSVYVCFKCHAVWP